MSYITEKFSKGLKILFVLSLGVCVVSFFMRTKLPEPEELLEDLAVDPVQMETAVEPFELEKSNVQWQIEPLYEYSVKGLVVSAKRYDFMAMLDSSHFYPLDLCLVWGDNLQNEAYRKARFWQDHRWCLWQTTCKVSLNGKQVSNNHLVPVSDEIYKKMQKAKKGDQVLVEGYLISAEGKALEEASKYTPEQMKYESSTSRDDSGGGACEFIYVTNFEILQKGQFWISLAYDVSKLVLVGTVVLWVIFFFADIFAPMKRRKREVKSVFGRQLFSPYPGGTGADQKTSSGMDSVAKTGAEKSKTDGAAGATGAADQSLQAAKKAARRTAGSGVGSAAKNPTVSPGAEQTGGDQAKKNSSGSKDESGKDQNADEEEFKWPGEIP